MNKLNSKNYLWSLGAYAAFLLLAELPIFPKPLNMIALAQLITAALVASVLIAIFNILELDKRLHDDGAAFFQAFLGIAICCGLYSVVSQISRPQLMFVTFVLWVAIGLPKLTPRKVLALSALYLVAYLHAFYTALVTVANPQHSEALFLLIFVGVVVAFMYSRASHYMHINSRHLGQEVALEAAESRIYELITQDSETTALKYMYFRNQLIKEKNRVDLDGGTFSICLVDIDQYDDMVRKIGDIATSQVLREFTERATKLIDRTIPHHAWPADYKPFGRISRGRFGLMLSDINYEQAMKCAERLHSAVDFSAIRTHAGVFGITLSIGVTEYASPEPVEEVLRLAERALDLAKQHNGNDFKGLKRPRGVQSKEPGLEIWNAHVVNH